MNYLANYLRMLSEKVNDDLSDSVSVITSIIIPKHIKNFSFSSHDVGLLVGDVQSGKTSHMFGLICGAADEGFMVFVLLTTDNIILQQQTFERAKHDLKDFCVCGENDYLQFCKNNLKKPVVVVLKKNARILKQWQNNFASTSFCIGNPLFIVDDEADASSLNTLVNRNNNSTINKTLTEIKKTTSSSVFIQVTGTPQAILLQAERSGWKPDFVYYFKPGNNYIGGNILFSGEKHPLIVFTDNNEAKEILIDDEFPENGLKAALITHLVTSAQLFLEGSDVCNFLIHPSVLTNQHNKFAEKVGDYLNEIASTMNEKDTQKCLFDAYNELNTTEKNLNSFIDILNCIKNLFTMEKISILVVNSFSQYDENVKYNSGVNIIVGGNSLGRGVTFPKLQTVYYCRLAKKPQADTMWQHSRIFGYDRNPNLIRLYMPPILYKLFSDINATNNSIISQIENSSIEDIKLYYPENLRPTRKNVLDNSCIRMYSGGVNYFPFYPTNTSLYDIDAILQAFGEETYTVSLKLLIQLLKFSGSEKDDWNGSTFATFVNTFFLENPSMQGKLIVRRNRDISKGTGTLLSPNDRLLGEIYNNEVVLTMYKVTGTKGWNGEKIWIPNIKLPSGVVYYSID